MAVYPGNVAVFSTKVDLQDTVFAEHVNALQGEVTSTQQVLGTNILASTWTTNYSNVATHTTVSSRLLNIEGGIRTLELTKLSLSGGNLTGAISGTSAVFSGSLQAGSLSGNGSLVTSLDAGNVVTGTINVGRLPDSGVVPGTYTKVTVDSTGRATSAGLLTQADMPAPLSSATAQRWASARVISLSGDLSGAVSLDGSNDVVLEAQITDLPPDFTAGFFLGGM